jgi:lysozyme family protein
LPDIISDIIRREGGATATNDPSDSGGRTQYGIAERSHPEAWADDKVTLDEARAIYLKQYVLPFEGIEDVSLLHQLVDMGVPSGPVTAKQTLQQVIGVTADGVLGPKTFAAIAAYPGGKLFGFPVPGSVLLNLAVRDARMLLYAGIAKRRPKDLKFLLGWLRRAMEFK